MARRVRDADAKAKTATRDLMDIRGCLREILDGAGIDRRDAGAENHPLGGEGQRRALRHVGKLARHVEAREPAALGFARDIQGLAPPPRHGNQSEGGHRIGHRDHSSDKCQS
jgi:hypothetical protein